MMSLLYDTVHRCLHYISSTLQSFQESFCNPNFFDGMFHTWYWADITKGMTQRRRNFLCKFWILVWMHFWRRWIFVLSILKCSKGGWKNFFLHWNQQKINPSYVSMKDIYFFGLSLSWCRIQLIYSKFKYLKRKSRSGRS